MSIEKNKLAAPPRPRGRPRSASAHAAILAAAHEILMEEGLTGVTVEAIAARAGVGKPTIYRTWPNAYAVAMAALISADSGSAKLAPSKSAVTQLKRQLPDTVTERTRLLADLKRARLIQMAPSFSMTDEEALLAIRPVILGVISEDMLQGALEATAGGEAETGAADDNKQDANEEGEQNA